MTTFLIYYPLKQQNSAALFPNKNVKVSKMRNKLAKKVTEKLEQKALLK